MFVLVSAVGMRSFRPEMFVSGLLGGCFLAVLVRSSASHGDRSATSHTSGYPENERRNDVAHRQLVFDEQGLTFFGGWRHEASERTRHRREQASAPFVFDWHRKNVSSGLNMETLPEFAEPVPNVTAIVGRTVKLPCVVNNLGQYRVAWLRVESKTILTIHKSVITQNYRVHLSPSDRSWLLVIDGVTEADRGGYMCQVNTVPMRSQVGYLDVLVPPDIVGSESSSDVLVREGSNVTLVCRAKGYPAPRITWRREDGQSIAVGNWQQHAAASDNVSFEGDELSVTKVSRLHMGPYLCIASNGVPSPVSRRILLQVHFPPMIWIPNQLIGAPLGGEVVMDCNTEAFPMSINYWTLEGGDLIAESSKYSLNRTENVYKVHMRLRIRRIVPEDFGAYRCFAKNSLGSTEGSIRLYEIHVPPPTKVKEPSTARIQSVEEGKLEVSGDAITKHQSFPLRPPISGPPKIQATDSSPSCVAAFYLLVIVEIVVAMVT